MKKRLTEEAKKALRETKVAFIKTQYPGVFYIETADGKKTFYVRYRDPSRKPRWEKAEAPEHPVVKTASQANAIRSARQAGRELPNEVRREKEGEAKKAEDARWTFDKLWVSWKEHNANKAGLSRDDSRYTKHLKEPFGDREPSDLKPLDIDRLKKQLFADDYAPDSIVSTISLLKRIANYGLDKQLCAGLTFRIKLNDKKLRRRNRTECLTPEQTEAYRKICREYPNKQIGNLCLLVEQSGIRHSNAVNLKWADVDFENGFIHLAETKSGESKDLPLSDVALKILQGHWDHHRTEASEFVFSGRDKYVPGKLSTREIRDGVAEIRDLADLPLFDGKKFRPLHGLRHALGSRLVNDGTSLFIVQNVLGHATPSVTARYSHLANTTLRDALNASNKPKSETA